MDWRDFEPRDKSKLSKNNEKATFVILAVYQLGGFSKPCLFWQRAPPKANVTIEKGSIEQSYYYF